MLFNSFYDIHSSTFGVMGAEFLRTLGELYALDGRQAVGILHNGGGASACQTIHASAYANAARLFSEAQSRLGIDTSRVVVTGGSRGGTSALGLSANPFADAYTATYILAVNPQTHPGEALHRFANPTYPLVQSGVAAGNPGGAALRKPASPTWGSTTAPPSTLSWRTDRRPSWRRWRRRARG